VVASDFWTIHEETKKITGSVDFLHSIHSPLHTDRESPKLFSVTMTISTSSPLDDSEDTTLEDFRNSDVIFGTRGTKKEYA
jgi:hypothetical protein